MLEFLSFLRLTNILLHVYATFCFSMHLSTGRNGYSHISVIANNVAVNLGFKYLFETLNLIILGILGAVLCRPQNSYVEVLTPGISECDCI